MSVHLMKVTGRKRQTLLAGHRLPLTKKSHLSWLGLVFCLESQMFGHDMKKREPPTRC